MECVFCEGPVQFGQQKMAHRIFDRSEPADNWWLCRDCAEIRMQGDKTEGLSGARGTCIDCDEPAAYAVSIMKRTPRGNVETDDTIFDVLCASHFDDRAS